MELGTRTDICSNSGGAQVNSVGDREPFQYATRHLSVWFTRSSASSRSLHNFRRYFRQFVISEQKKNGREESSASEGYRGCGTEREHNRKDCCI